MKHGGDAVIVWVCFAAYGPGPLTITERAMNYMLRLRILKENVGKFVCKQVVQSNQVVLQKDGHREIEL